jgi:Fe2+ transport system protein FeoA
VGVLALVLGLLAAPLAAEAQTPGNVHRVGIIHVSGHHHVVVDGLRQRLRELGLEEGKHLVLDIREIQGDLKAAEEAARNLERGNVEAIHFCISCTDCNSKSVLCLCTRI